MFLSKRAHFLDFAVQAGRFCACNILYKQVRYIYLRNSLEAQQIPVARSLQLSCVCVCVLLSYVYLLCYVRITFFWGGVTLDAGLLATSRYSEGPATGHLDTGFSWFPCVYKQTLRWFPRFQVATTCFSCSPPDLNSVVTNFIFCIHVK